MPTAFEFTNIGRYKVIEKLGQGAMGVVYLCLDEMIDRKVAVKMLRLDKIKSDTERKKAYDLIFQEARIIGKLVHSHITSIYDMGVQDNSPYLVMEFVEGKDIASAIKTQAPVSIAEKLRMVAMAARALHYAHQRGILHRDIKPANIMILPNHSPKIMDFGISRLKDAATEAWSAGQGEEEGIILGTPNYMSPEQIRGKELDQRSDLFSLAILTYEWISGRKPFTGPDLKELLKSILKGTPDPLVKLVKGADNELDTIIYKALEKERDNRYRTAEDFSEAIELYLSKQEMKNSAQSTAIFPYDKKKVVDQLRKNYFFFADFCDEELFSIFKMSGKERYGNGEAIVQEGTSGTKMYIIVSGMVKVVKDVNGKEIELKRLGEGDCFGELSIIDKMPRSASVVAMEPTVVIAINEVVLRTSEPALCMKLYKNLAAIISEKLRWSDARVLDLLTNQPEGTTRKI